MNILPAKLDKSANYTALFTVKYQIILAMPFFPKIVEFLEIMLIMMNYAKNNANTVYQCLQSWIK